MFVEVSLPLPLLKTFYYRCPERLFAQLQPGQRVFVPFQNRRLPAFVIDTCQQLPDDFPSEVAVKEIIGSIDSSSLVSTELFELSKWISEYYFASQGEVLRACLPPGFRTKTAKMATLTTSGLNAFEQMQHAESPAAREMEILNTLASNGSVELKMLGKLLGLQENDRTFRKLVTKGWIELRHDLLDRSIEPKKQTVVALLPDSAKKSASPGLADRQTHVMQFLEDHGTVLLSTLVTTLKVSSSVVRSLEKKGLLRIFSKQIQRDPFQAMPGFLKAEPRHHTEEQLKVLGDLKQALRSGSFVAALLHGVTGSGKTEVYQCLIEETLAGKKTALLLMPEIGLTPRAAQEFRERFGHQVAILHSALSDGERFDEWWRIKRGEARVVIGTRSAVFAPLANLGLIVVDEEHDPSYKQQDSPRYHARDTALVRGKIANALVVLGSATPAIETFYNAKGGKYRYLPMLSRVHFRPLPEVTLIDMREEFKALSKSSVFSRALRQEIQKRLDCKEQVLILLNRRGFSACVLCRSCGQTIHCENCSISLTFHRAANRLRCHYCSYQRQVPKVCPHCSSEHLYFQREGTEKAEALLVSHFPGARIARLDRDTAQRKHAHVNILSQFLKGDTDILTGTQMIAKGHDFHNVTLAGILAADTSLSFPDFRCAERTFQLLTQMSGRAGRGDLPGQVLIQTFYPEHYCLKFVAQHDYEGFYEKEIRFRKMMHYPPFNGMANILVRDRNLDRAAEVVSAFGKIVQDLSNGQLRILGPTLSPLAKLKGEHRFQLLVKAKSRVMLREVLKRSLETAEAEKLDICRIHIDIDPVTIM